MDIVRHLTSGAGLDDEADWEFDATWAVASPANRRAEWNEKDGPDKLHSEAIGNL